MHAERFFLAAVPGLACFGTESRQKGRIREGADRLQGKSENPAWTANDTSFAGNLLESTTRLLRQVVDRV